MNLSVGERELWQVAGWTVHEFTSLPSTNPVAGGLPPWHAARADLQTGGRGRTGRNWVSDAGGLWISAVVPTGEPRRKWAVLPLAVGWALIEALRAVGAHGLRLRWPNDVLVGNRKLAGLLVEQFRPDAAVVGIGLNVFNQPTQVDASLSGRAVSLSEIAPGDYTVRDIARVVLESLRRSHGRLDAQGFAPLAREINGQWDRKREVELALNSAPGRLRGRFEGIDEEGRLAVVTSEGDARVLDASQVALLTELD